MSGLLGLVVNKSPLYETEPIGGPPQERFYNCVVELHSELSPHRLLKGLRTIEKELGRKREVRWGPRTMDLDILFYDDRVIQETGLTIPHPRLHQRKFVLIPLSRIAPDYYHPLFSSTVSELLSQLRETQMVRPVVNK